MGFIELKKSFLDLDVKKILGTKCREKASVDKA